MPVFRFCLISTHSVNSKGLKNSSSPKNNLAPKPSPSQVHFLAKSCIAFSRAFP